MPFNSMLAATGQETRVLILVFTEIEAWSCLVAYSSGVGIAFSAEKGPQCLRCIKKEA